MTEDQRAETTLKEFLPGDITPEEIEMMIFIQRLLGRNAK